MKIEPQSLSNDAVHIIFMHMALQSLLQNIKMEVWAEASELFFKAWCAEDHPENLKQTEVMGETFLLLLTLTHTCGTTRSCNKDQKKSQRSYGESTEKLEFAYSSERRERLGQEGDLFKSDLKEHEVLERFKNRRGR